MTTSDASIVGRLRSWARSIKRDVHALYLSARDPRVPWYAKAVALAVAAYALSPIDLIPDFIPVLGFLDDVIVLPLGIACALRMIPPAVMEASRQRAAQFDGSKPHGVFAAVVIVVAWLAVIAATVSWTMAR